MHTEMKKKRNFSELSICRLMGTIGAPTPRMFKSADLPCSVPDGYRTAMSASKTDNVVIELSYLLRQKKYVRLMV